ncbi:probable mitogen-activated protein kinase HOG1 [Cephalotrichum gorgonifer]|uniref:non-specific serine/threonine protein kinase n=1 Tax=Cephalotrichum gorgonifer TaxID=2041049 RepID=A0AAE8SY63_9PEZI|nr:probable mitogen-activated protein kinase HOG1 [Cephalotrichum gorgonifer]
MASVARRPLPEEQPFAIHQDAVTDEIEMGDDPEQRTEEIRAPEEEEVMASIESSEAESSEAESAAPTHVVRDMERLGDDIPGFREKYRLIKRIGEGTFSTVYKAEDLQYDRYLNEWDIEEKEATKWVPPPVRRTQDDRDDHFRAQEQPRRRPKYVAIKKIYVTSSPARIYNELELLHVLRNCASVCPLITAFRHTDQVVAILPYFRHADFRDYFRHMTITDTAIYLRSLFTALESVHAHHILHRDIKPTNFLYDPATKRGVLVDFGLAEREGTDARPCLCHESPTVRRRRAEMSVAGQAGPQQGYPKADTRPSRRANRAGTRGFRAPEVLFKCTEQTTKLDIWSAGVILLTILSRRFPFFNSADDVEALVEIATIFGTKKMKAAGLLHGCVLETTIPTIGLGGFNLEKIILWSTCRTDGGKDGQGQPLDAEEKLAVEFLNRCMDLDPSKRISATEALQHDFLKLPEKGLPGYEEEDLDDEMDFVTV